MNSINVKKIMGLQLPVCAHPSRLFSLKVKILNPRGLANSWPPSPPPPLQSACVGGCLGRWGGRPRPPPVPPGPAVTASPRPSKPSTIASFLPSFAAAPTPSGKPSFSWCWHLAVLFLGWFVVLFMFFSSFCFDL